ncbi:hypothetical protein HAX54_037840 [Datura stramonium]|uniref:Uncharacterized protein n=1 Tax=Datura stramonium TaxID=4076 RepID=A0ABS8VIV2_DATST|nr:hypothetical protein [Datura stramonium]
MRCSPQAKVLQGTNSSTCFKALGLEAAKPLEWTDSSSTVTGTVDWMSEKEINEDEEWPVQYLDTTGPQMKILGVEEAPATRPTTTMGQTPTLDDLKVYEGLAPPASSARDDKNVPVYIAPLE